MKKLFLTIVLLCSIGWLQAQEEEKLILSGELTTDQRFRLADENDWLWNENRLDLQLNKKINEKSKFNSKVWLRNFGLPTTISSTNLYSKSLLEPVSIEIREANFQVNDFLINNLDLKIGRQRIAWGTADKLNPTDNINPYDMEDILDFGRHRSSDAFNLNYYFSNNLSLQGIFVPFFRPANLPVGNFATLFNPQLNMPGLTLQNYNLLLATPITNLGKNNTTGAKLKGSVAGIDISASYAWTRTQLPVASINTIIPIDTLGGVNIISNMHYPRMHVMGLDLATSLKGVGIWGEAALSMPERDIVMKNNLSALFPLSPVPVEVDSILIKKDEPVLKYIFGCDYHFSEGSYINFQYLHGFVHELAKEELNDYFFIRYEKPFFNDKLKIAPLSGAYVVNDWNEIKDNYALIYMPEISYQATDDAKLSLAATIFEGKGNNIFARLKDYNMFLIKFSYNF